MDVALIVGIFGALLLLVAFALNEFGVLDREALSFDVMNFFGASFLAYYALAIASTPFLVLNIIWALVALRDVVVGLRKL